MPGISAVSPPISAQPACRQPSAMPSTIAAPMSGVELAGGEIVEEEQRLGALDDESLTHMATRSMPMVSCTPGLDGDLQLGADAVGGRDQHRVVEAGGLEVEQPAEAADLGVGARPARRAHQRLDRLDQGVAGVDVDAGLGVGQPVVLIWLAHRHGPFSGLQPGSSMNARRAARAGAMLARFDAQTRWTTHRQSASHLPVRLRLDMYERRGRRSLPDNLPNLITIGRFILVPFVVAMIGRGELGAALSSVSSSPASPTPSTASSPASSTSAPNWAPIWIPMADKLLLVSIYVVLASWANCRAGSSSWWCRATC